MTKAQEDCFSALKAIQETRRELLQRLRDLEAIIEGLINAEPVDKEAG